MENKVNNNNFSVPNPNWLKAQGFVAFDQMKMYTKDEITIVKWSKTYVSFLDVKILNREWVSLCSGPKVRYDPEGVGLERGLEICQAVDFISHKKYFQPQTYDDKIAQEKNKSTTLLKKNNKNYDSDND